MPGTIRATSGRPHPRSLRDGFAASIAAMMLGSTPARADGPSLPGFDAYVEAFAALDRHEIAALVLTLGVLFFAVTTAVLLVRTRLRTASAHAAYRDQIIALKAEGDRFNALLLSEPQILVSWAAADNEPEIMGDTTLVTTAAMPQRVLAFGSWLEPDKAQAMERAVDALRAAGESFAMQLITLAGH